MSSSACDPIAFVEACYDLGASDKQWLRAASDILRPLMKAKTLLGYHADFGPRGVRVHDPVQSGEEHGDVAARIASVGELFERQRAGRASVLERLKARLHAKAFSMLLEDPVDRMLLSERRTFGPSWVYTLGAPGVRELLFMVNHHIDGHGATFLVGALAEKAPLRPAERAMLLRLGAHLKAGFRLRRRLPTQLRAVCATEDGAVLDSAARLVHAEGEAREGEAPALLEQAAREVDRARTQKHGRGEEALAVWQGLVDGRWSLVERFDADGKRFYLAHRNPEDVRDPRGLTPLEARIMGLAARGYADKLIAYHLGVAEGTVSSQLARAMRKLGIAGRLELVRTFGRNEPCGPKSSADPEPS